VSPSRPSVKALLLTAAVAVAALAAGCGPEEANLSNGKALFVQKCGSCHALKRAGTQGVQGPNLDQAFGPARRDGLGSKTVRGVVRDQIANVRRGSIMPRKLVTGDDARDVAAYVAEVAGQPGQDRGALAQAGLAGAREGKQIFVAAGCGSCHKLADAGTNGNVGPSLDELAAQAAKLGKQRGQSPAEYVMESIVKPGAFTVSGFSAGVMPSNYGDRLEPSQIKALVEYLLRVGKGG
jgi:mono/diheme cytochrome c family protein